MSLKKNTPIFLPKSKIKKLYEKQIKFLNSLEYNKLIELESEINSNSPIEDENELAMVLTRMIKETSYKPSKEDIEKIGRHFIPSKKKTLNKCLSEYDNVKEKGYLKYEVSKNKKKYYVNIISLKYRVFLSKEDFYSYIKSFELTKKASNLGISPRIHEVFTCRDQEGDLNIFVVNEHVEGETLNKWLLKNKLTDKDKKEIKKVIDKCFDNGIIPGFINNNNIVALKNKKFILAPLLYASSFEDIIKERKSQTLDNLEWISKVSQEKIDNLALKILIRDKKIKIS